MIFQGVRENYTFYFNTVNGEYYSANHDRYKLKSFKRWDWKTPIEERRNVILSPALVARW